VVIGSRDPTRAADAAEQIAATIPEAGVSGLANAEAVPGAGIVALCVPFESQVPTLQSVAPSFQPGQVLLDATVPLATAAGGRPTRVLGVWQGSAAEQAQEMLPPGVSVVSALHTVAASHLRDLEHVFDEDVLVTGDDDDAKRQVAELISRIPGLRPVDAGRLEMARITEQLTALMIGINIRYRVAAGVRIAGLKGQPWALGTRPA
jgi:NADPH-dependent F420 reductase